MTLSLHAQPKPLLHATNPRRQQTGDEAVPRTRLIAMGPSSYPSHGGTERGDETPGCCPTSEGNGAPVPLQPRCHHEDVPGGDIGTESQGKVWIRRTEPHYGAAAPGAGLGAARMGGGDAVIGPCSPSPPPPLQGPSAALSARRPAGPGAAWPPRPPGEWTAARSAADLRQAQTAA